MLRICKFLYRDFSNTDQRMAAKKKFLINETIICGP